MADSPLAGLFSPALALSGTGFRIRFGYKAAKPACDHWSADWWNGARDLRAALELADSAGAALFGESLYDRLGASLAAAGDVNGDGFDDFILGAFANGEGGYNAGAAYVIFGRAGGIGSVDLAGLDPGRGFKILGDAPYDRAGLSVAAAGDVDGDGFDDILVGAPGHDGGGGANAGAAYLILGKGTGLREVDLANLAVGDGVRFEGAAASDYAGHSVAAAGDVNGDGFADFAIGAYGRDGYAGAVYLVFGDAAGIGPIDLAALDPADGVAIAGGVAGDRVGVRVTAAGDFNGDGIGDIAVGADGHDGGGADAGMVYVIFGRGTGFASVDLADLDAADGFAIRGEAAGDRLGLQIAAAGDVDADGCADLLLGAFNDSNGHDAGAAYLIFGKQAGMGPLDLAALDPADGIRIAGATAEDAAGIGVAGAGDVNGDGFDDVLIGAFLADGGGIDRGAAYLLFGRATGWGGLDLAALGASDGFRLDGASDYGHAGASVAGAGDVDGDGYDDLLVGAPDDDTNGAGAGAAYIVHGAATAAGPPAGPPGVDLNGAGAGTGFSSGHGEGGPGAAIGASVIVTAPNGPIMSAAITIADAESGDRLELDGSLPAGLVASGLGGPSLLLGGAAPAAAYEAALAMVRYASTSDDPTAGGTHMQRSIAVAVNDGSSDSAIATALVAIAAVNDGPVAVDDDLVAEQDVAAVYTPADLVGNDVDPDGPQLVIAAVGNAVNGGVTISGGNVVFTPAPGFSGIARFDYTVSDGLVTDIGRATIAVAPTPNRPPQIAHPVADRDSPEDEAFSFQIPADAFLDPDGDPLLYSASLAGALPLPAWLGFDAATRTFVGTPPQDFHGTIAVKVTASDGSESASDAFDLVIAPVNDAPTLANPIPDHRGDEDAPVFHQLPTDSFADVDGDALTYSAALDDGSALPPWLRFDAGTRTFSGTPPPDFHGTIAVKVTASDGSESASDAFDLVIAPVNDAPALADPLPDHRGDEDAPVSYQLPADSFADVDGDALTYGAALDDGSALPLWLRFDAGTRTFSGVPPQDFHGTITIRVIASDGAAEASDLFDLVIDAANDAPVAAADAYVTAEDTILAIAAGAGLLGNDTDADGDLLSAILVTGPGHGTLSLNPDGSLSYAPEADYHGADSFTYRADDGGAAGDIATVTLTIIPVNDAPSGTDSTIDIAEDGSRALVQADFGFSDAAEGHLFAGVAIAALPADGLLLLNGAPIIAAGTFVTEAEIAAGLLVFRPGEDEHGAAYARFGFQVRDTGGLADGGRDMAPSANLLTFNVAAVNDAPVNIVPAAQRLDEDGRLVFGAGHGNAIAVADIDSGTGDVTIVLTIADGALILAATAGLTAFSGNGTSQVALTGSLAGVNAALDGLTYTPPANANGGRSLAIATSDDGHSGSGGALTDTDMVAIVVDPVNDAPAGTAGTVTGSEDDPYIFRTGDFGFSDPVEGHGLLAVIFESLPAAGQVLLDGAPIAAGDAVAASAIDAARLVFRPAPGGFGSPYASFAFRVRDDGGTADGGIDTAPAASMLTVDIAPDNLPPEVDLNGPGAGMDHDSAYIENGAPVAIGSAIAVSDPNEAAGDQIVSAIVTLEGAEAGDVLTHGALPPGLAAAISQPAGRIVIAFTGAAAPAIYAALLADVRYANVGEAPAGGTRSIAVIVDDSSADTAAATARIDVTPVDDAPVARSDAAATDEASVLTGSVLGNDSDVDGPALAVVAVNGIAANVGAEIGLASGALLLLEADGAFRYDPNHAFDAVPAAGSGASNLPAADHFSYTLAGGGTARTTVTIHGLDGNDILFGTSGVDTLSGGVGNDLYYVDRGQDRVIEAAGGGSDTVYASAAYALAADADVEILSTASHGSTAAIDLTGNALANTLIGNAGANLLSGGIGADVMVGLGGNDSYIVDSAADRAIEAPGGGNDTVYAGFSYLLAAAWVETLSTTSLAGTGAINLTGNALANLLIGNQGANLLNGGAGGDTMMGFGGNDGYILDNAADRVVEAAGGGVDTVYAGFSYALPFDQEVETLATSSQAGTQAINLTGNNLSNSILGNAGANVLNGLSGTDYLQGLGGNDTYYVDAAAEQVFEAAGQGVDTVYASASYALRSGQSVEAISTASHGATTAIDLTGNETANTLIGNAGVNILDGKGGNDSLVGLGGADIFAFTTAPGAGNVDTVAGFQAGVDRIALDDAAFAGLTPATLDRIVYNAANGQLLFDADGTGPGAAILFARLDPGLALTASDFSVI